MFSIAPKNSLNVYKMNAKVVKCWIPDMRIPICFVSSLTHLFWPKKSFTSDNSFQQLRAPDFFHPGTTIIITIIIIISILPDGEGGDQVRADKRRARSPWPTWHDCEGTTRWKTWEIDQPYETVEVPPGDKILELFWNCLENLEFGPHGWHDSEGTTTWQKKKFFLDSIAKGCGQKPIS